jgi:hypothetical protein
MKSCREAGFLLDDGIVVCAGVSAVPHGIQNIPENCHYRHKLLLFLKALL